MVLQSFHSIQIQYLNFMNNTDLDKVYFEAFPYTLFKITPALRRIYLDLTMRPDKKFTLIAYYDAQPSEIEMELLDDLGSDILGFCDYFIDYDLDISATLLSFDNLRQTNYLLYGRYESTPVDTERGDI